jgi:hypothetical protein
MIWVMRSFYRHVTLSWNSQHMIGSDCMYSNFMKEAHKNDEGVVAAERMSRLKLGRLQETLRCWHYVSF